MNIEDYQYAWVFNGAPWQPASGVFSSMILAEDWIHADKLSGLLTAYPLDIGVYDWAIKEKIFHPKKDRDFTAHFIGQFTSASQPHYHYENGKGGNIGMAIEQRKLSDIPSKLRPAIWLFTGLNSTHVSGVFTSKETAESWIAMHKLDGHLVLFPVDISIYHWAIQQGIFTPRSRKEKRPDFIHQFTFATFAGQEMYLYREGRIVIQINGENQTD